MVCLVFKEMLKNRTFTHWSINFFEIGDFLAILRVDRPRK